MTVEDINLCHPSQRLMIYKMILTNFKSYAGRQEIGPFHQSFSAVVGPNGSGKSNVIDALLFVFGFRASKLRQPKASDLIHHSDAYPNAETCSVQIVFCQCTAESSPVPSTHLLPPSTTEQIIVERIAFKNPNKSSEYLINGKTVTAKEIITFLSEKGVDLDHNRFLILQGEVESIALMKPKSPNEHEEGLLEYLEDIIGSNKYKPLIEASFLDLETCSQEANQKIAQLRIIEKDMEAKYALKLEAEKYLKDENDITIKKSLHYQLLKYEADQSIRLLKGEQDTLESKLLQFKSDGDANQAQLAHLEKDDAKMDQELKRLEKSILDEQKRLGDLEKVDIRCQENRKHLKEKLAKLNKSMSQEHASNIAQRQTFESLQIEFDNKNKQLDILKKNLLPAEIELNRLRESLKGKTYQYQGKIDTLQKQMSPLVDKLNSLSSEKEVVEAECETLKDKIFGIQHLWTNLMDESNTLTKAYKDQEEKFLADEAQLSQNEKELASLRDSKKSLTDLERSIETDLGLAKNRTYELRQAIQTSSSGSQILNYLMNDSSIEGIYGRLGDLGSIDDKYEVALSAATGALDHIVVESSEIGQKCIEALRQKGLGRATFIILEKMKDYLVDMKKVREMHPPPNSHYLFNLVDPSQINFAPAFYFALRDTLVTDNLQLANQVAFGTTIRRRVVTLDGKLIDKSGTMTGGSSSSADATGSGRKGQVLKSKSSVSTSKKELEKSEKDIKLHITRLEETGSLIKECDARMEMLENALAVGKLSFAKLKKDMQFTRDRVATVRKGISEQETKKPPPEDVNKLKELEKKIASFQERQTDIEAQIHVLKEKIQQEEASILDSGGVQFKSQLNIVEGYKEQIETIEARLGKVKTELLSLEKFLCKADQDIKETEVKVKSIQTEISSLDQQLDSNLKEATLVQATIEKSKNEMGLKTDETADARKQLSTLRKNNKLLKTAELDTHNHLLDVKEKLKTVAVELEGIVQDLSCLKLHSFQSDNEMNESNAESPRLYLSEPSEVDLQLYDKKSAKLLKEITMLQEKLGNNKPYLGVIEEYQQLQTSLKNQEEETNLTVEKRDVSQERWESLKKSRLDEFMKGFQIISTKLKEMYQMITMGGNAELELVDSLDPFSEGILFSVMPPKKTWKNICYLSGGEKTLSSLALVFALHHYKPTPIYVMDEIDAALDFRNVSIVANYIRERTKNAQFIVISLRNNMFELASTLLGVYKTQHCTKSVALSPSLMIKHIPYMDPTNNN